MIEGVSRLIDALPDDEFLQREKQIIEHEKYEVMIDRDRFAEWLDEILRRFAAESKRRNLAAG
jgi:hypothetical protein